jgi:5-methylcytosine-specific restriction protein A
MKDPLFFDRHRKHPEPSGPGEEKRCRWCRGPITKKGRTSWCSTECADEGAVRSSASYARFKVEERDHGICAACGMDTEYVKRTLNPLLKEATTRWREPDVGQELRRMVAIALEDLGFSRAVAFVRTNWSHEISTHLWEADHILPVVEGGGGCGLDNLRTLCRACHHRETKALAGRRAKTVRLVKKRSRHEARMRAKQTRLPLVERDWRGRRK